jgi:hypothetical protein
MGMIGAIAMTLLLVAYHERLLPLDAVLLGDQSLAIGNQKIHQQIESIVRG